MSELERWIEERGVSEVECLIPDMNGVLRGKVLPAAKLVQSDRDGSLRLPSSVFAVTVTGEYAGPDDDEAYSDPDMVLRPDPATLRLAPGLKTPTAFVFADAYHPDGSPWASSPREVLKTVCRPLPRPGLAPDRRAGAGVLSHRAQSRSGFPADPARRAARAAPRPRRSPMGSRRSTSTRT